MAPEPGFAKNGDVSIAYETFATPPPEFAAWDHGLDFQMVWWPTAFCTALAERGSRSPASTTGSAGLSRTRLGRKDEPVASLMGRTKPAYTTLDMLDDALAVMDALGWQARTSWVARWARAAQALAVYHPDRVRR